MNNILLAEIEAIRREQATPPSVRQLGDVGLDDLLAMAERLAHAHAYAAEMELGASGFDNMESVRHYSDLQRHLLAAAREILLVCGAMVQRERW